MKQTKLTHKAIYWGSMLPKNQTVSSRLKIQHPLFLGLGLVVNFQKYNFSVSSRKIGLVPPCFVQKHVSSWPTKLFYILHTQILYFHQDLNLPGFPYVSTLPRRNKKEMFKSLSPYSGIEKNISSIEDNLWTKYLNFHFFLVWKIFRSAAPYLTNMCCCVAENWLLLRGYYTRPEHRGWAQFLNQILWQSGGKHQA